MTNLTPPFEPVPATGADGISKTANRRVVLKAGATVLGLGATGLAGLNAVAQESAGTATPAASATTCVLTPELTEGPYYVEEILVRKNIVEDRAGLPLTLKIAVQDPTSCAPLTNAAVDVWHCDAQGYYSGISGENPGGGATGEENLDTTFLRGVQLTDANGVAEFETIYPGWYAGRAVHIHMKVHVDGATSGDTYTGGHVAHTGQLFFDDAVSAQVYEADAYAGRDNARRTLNDQDNILGDHDNEPGFMLELTPLKEGTIDDGFTGTITVGVDPSATPAAAGMGGPGGPPPNGNGQPPGNSTAASNERQLLVSFPSPRSRLDGRHRRGAGRPVVVGRIVSDPARSGWRGRAFARRAR